MSVVKLQIYQECELGIAYLKHLATSMLTWLIHKFRTRTDQLRKEKKERKCIKVTGTQNKFLRQVQKKKETLQSFSLVIGGSHSCHRWTMYNM